VTTNLVKARSFLDMMNKGFLLFRKHHVMLPTYSIGHPEYGCFISKDKTMTNFDYDHQIMNVVDQRARRAWSIFHTKSIVWKRSHIDFHWCGYAIDMKDLSISVDYSRYHGTSKPSMSPNWRLPLMNEYSGLSNTLTIARGRKPGLNFVRKMLRWVVFHEQSELPLM